MKLNEDDKEPDKSIIKVSLREIDISMRDIVVFTVKWAIASIPALLIILFVLLLFFYIFMGRYLCPV